MRGVASMDNDKPESWKKYHKPMTHQEIERKIKDLHRNSAKRFALSFFTVLLLEVIGFVATVYFAHELWVYFDGGC